jgi:predicted deacylase
MSEQRLAEPIPIDEFAPSQLQQGLKQRLSLHVATDLMGPLTLTALTVAGAAPGPTLLAVAGVHGDEYEGMEAIRHIFHRLDPQAMTGTFIGIPVANPLAYASRSRATPAHVDGFNLARVFPGDPNGTLTRRLAHHLLALVERLVGPDDLFIDLHSGSADVAFAPMIGIRDLSHVDQSATEEVARRFGLARLWLIPDSPGPFNAETARRGIPTLGTETTGRAGCDPADVATYTTGLHNLLACKRIVPTLSSPPRYDGPLRQTIDLLAPAGGFFRTSMRLDDEVMVGTHLGEIIDVAGEPIIQITAPVDGAIWAWRSTPAVHPGDLLGMIALAP